MILGFLNINIMLSLDSLRFKYLWASNHRSSISHKAKLSSSLKMQLCIFYFPPIYLKLFHNRECLLVLQWYKHKKGKISVFRDARS